MRVSGLRYEIIFWLVVVGAAIAVMGMLTVVLGEWFAARGKPNRSERTLNAADNLMDAGCAVMGCGPTTLALLLAVLGLFALHPAKTHGANVHTEQDSHTALADYVDLGRPGTITISARTGN